MDIAPNLQLSLESLIGQRIALLGTSGQGKSNTAKVLVEELVASDSSIPITIIDRDNEYWPMSAIGPFIRVGRGDNMDVECDIEHVDALARFSVEQGVSVILSLAHLKRTEYRPYVERYLNSLWEAITFRKDKRPYMLFVEEAQEFAPQKGSSETKELLIEISKRGRKHGLGMVLATQRAVSVDKDVISQASIRIFHKAAYANDVAVYVDNIPYMSAAEVQRINSGLTKGQAIIVIDNEQVQVAQIRRARIHDAGATPGINSLDRPATRSIDERLLTKLQKFLVKGEKPQPINSNEAVLLKRIKELETALAAKDKALKVAQTQVRQLQAKKSQPVQKPALKPSPVKPVARPKNDVQSALLNHAVERERKSFNTLLTKIRKVNAVWKSAFVYLLASEGDRLSIEQLSKRLAYKVESLYKNQPMFLLEQGLVARDGTGVDTVYWATATKELKQRFPNMSTSTMIQQLIATVSRD
jgi:hypothetical protein